MFKIESDNLHFLINIIFLILLSIFSLPLQCSPGNLFSINQMFKLTRLKRSHLASELLKSIQGKRKLLVIRKVSSFLYVKNCLCSIYIAVQEIFSELSSKFRCQETRIPPVVMDSFSLEISSHTWAGISCNKSRRIALRKAWAPSSGKRKVQVTSWYL